MSSIHTAERQLVFRLTNDSRSPKFQLNHRFRAEKVSRVRFAHLICVMQYDEIGIRNDEIVVRNDEIGIRFVILNILHAQVE